MTSLDKLQQTIELLNAVRGVSVGVQNIVQKVTSVARTTLDVANQGAVNLALSMDALMAKLQTSVRVSAKVVVDPVVSVIPTVDVTPQIMMVPEVTLAPKLNINPAVNIVPQLNVAPVVDIAPQLNIHPAVNIAPQLNINPAVNIAPQLNIKPALNIAPQLNIKPALNIAPQLNIKPVVDIAPQLNFKPALNFVPQLNIKPAVNIAPQLNIKPTLNVAPTLNVKPTVNFKPTFNFSPTLKFTPKVKVAPKVSIIGSIMGVVKKSVMAFTSALRVLAFGAFNALRVGILSVLPAIFAFTMALLANPMTWVVVGIVALIAAIVGLIVYWDQVTAAVGNFFAGLSDFASMEIFEPLKVWWSDFTGWLSSLDPFAMISQGWEWIKSLFSDNAFIQAAFSPLTLIGKVVDGVVNAFKKIPQWWAGFKTWLADLNPLGKVSDGIKKLGSWFGIGGDDDAEEAIDQSVVEQQKMSAQVKLPGAAVMENNASNDGLMQTISNEFGGEKKVTQVDKIEVHNHSTGVRGSDLAYELEMAAG